MVRKYDISKKSDMDKFMKDLKKDIIVTAREKAHKTFFETECPNCKNEVKIRTGSNICPHCQERINLKLDF